MKLRLALRLLLLMILQLCHLHLLSLLLSNSTCLFAQCQALCARCRTVLFKGLYRNIKNVFFIFLYFLVFMYCLREKYSKPITVYVADCISWVPSLTLLALWTNWTYKHTLGVELIHGWRTYCIFITSNLRSLQDRCCYLPTNTHTHTSFISEKDTKAERGWLIHLRSHCWDGEEFGFKLNAQVLSTIWVEANPGGLSTIAGTGCFTL